MKCPWGCGWEKPLEEYSEHFDKCEKRLMHPLYKKVKPTITIKRDEEEEIPNFLERLKIIEEEEPEIPWVTRIGRRPK